MERIVLAYSGGVDTSAAIPWLKEQHGADVITVTLDRGQGRELDRIRERALASGAVRAHVLDAREEFASGYILPALQAGALYEDRYPLATALGRPLIARKLVEIADMERTAAIAHGCVGKGTDQVRLEIGARTLNPGIRVVAPAREWALAGLSRADILEYARTRGISVPPAARAPYATDENLWGRSIQCGALEDPWAEAPEDVFTLTKSAADAPAEPAYVEVEFTQGVPTAVNGIPMPLPELIANLETIAGVHGVGRIDMVENRLVGIKSREIYEAPAAVVLHAAHRDLEGFVVPADLQRVKRSLAGIYADLVYNGLWTTPTREAIDAFVASVQQRVTGVVRAKLWKGQCQVVGRQSPFGLYDLPLATYGAADTFDHAAAAGFIRIWGLPLETLARRTLARDVHAELIKP
jgi:argininosuccinate synthase